MKMPMSAHPSGETLKAFGLGKLDDRRAETVLNHLDACATCCEAIAALSGDDFLERLRAAYAPTATPVPRKSLSGLIRNLHNPGPAPAPDVPPELAQNEQYEIMRELGRGGMGVVYLARNKLMDRLEVLKVMNKALLDRPDTVERFLREIRSAAKLSHPNVVTAHTALQLGGLVVFAMEYVEGVDLAQLVKQRGPLPVQHACWYVQQAAAGLQHASDRGMVHRDIKPQNLILSREGKRHVVKVLDFGLAKVLREKVEGHDLTGTGAMLGTPDYVAPEQTVDAARADIRADIYSLGCTLYSLLAGHPPFEGTLYEILTAHHTQEARPLDLERPEVPEELAAVVRQMMAKDPAKRFQTPAEVVRALAPFVKPGAKAPVGNPGPELAKGSTNTLGGRGVLTSPRPSQAPAARGTCEPVTQPGRSPQGTQAPIAKALPSGGEPPPLPIPRPAAWKKWPVVVAAVIVLAVVGLWAGGVFRVKTAHGTIVLEDVPADANVTVDGDAVVLDTKDGKPIELRIAAAGKHELEVTKAGFRAFTKDIAIDAGGRQTIKVHLGTAVDGTGGRQSDVADKPLEELFLEGSVWKHSPWRPWHRSRRAWKSCFWKAAFGKGLVATEQGRGKAKRSSMSSSERGTPLKAFNPAAGLRTGRSASSSGRLRAASTRILSTTIRPLLKRPSSSREAGNWGD